MLTAGPVSGRVVYRWLRRHVRAQLACFSIRWPRHIELPDEVGAALRVFDMHCKTLHVLPGLWAVRVRGWDGRQRHPRRPGPGDRADGLRHAAGLAALLRAAWRAGVPLTVREGMTHYVNWREAPCGSCPVQGVFEVGGHVGYARTRGESWSVELWPAEQWPSDRDELPGPDPVWWADGPVGCEPYEAGYLDSSVVMGITDLVVDMWGEGHPGGPNINIVEHIKRGPP